MAADARLLGDGLPLRAARRSQGRDAGRGSRPRGDFGRGVAVQRRAAPGVHALEERAGNARGVRHGFGAGHELPEPEAVRAREAPGPNPRAGEAMVSEIVVEVADTADAVAALEAEVRAIQGTTVPMIHPNRSSRSRRRREAKTKGTGSPGTRGVCPLCLLIGLRASTRHRRCRAASRGRRRRSRGRPRRPGPGRSACLAVGRMGLDRERVGAGPYVLDADRAVGRDGDGVEGPLALHGRAGLPLGARLPGREPGLAPRRVQARRDRDRRRLESQVAPGPRPNRPRALIPRERRRGL